MKSFLNPGRVAGLWYLLLVISGPLKLLYIPSKVMVTGNPAATAHNLSAQAALFRWGMVDEAAMAVILIFLVMAFYRLFEGVDRGMAALVVIFGGVMPATLHLTGTVTDAGALLAAQGADFLSGFSQAQRDGLVTLFLKLHGWQYTSAETLWGMWLLPLAVLVFRSGFLPRLLGIWLAMNGIAYVIISATGLLLPQYQSRVFSLATPALYGELAIMLWLVVKGAKPPIAKA